MCPNRVDGFAQQAFQRIDQNSDGQITGKEIKARLKETGVPGGPFGAVHSGAVDAFMDTFDKDGDEQISLDEYMGESQTFLPKGTFDETGKTSPERIEAQFQRLDGDGDGRLTAEEIRARTKQDLEAEGASHAGYKAEIAGRMGVDVLDTSRDGAVTREEFQQAADDAAK